MITCIIWHHLPINAEDVAIKKAAFKQDLEKQHFKDNKV